MVDSPEWLIKRPPQERQTSVRTSLPVGIFFQVESYQRLNHWYPAATLPDVRGSALGLVSPVSVNCGWVTHSLSYNCPDRSVSQRKLLSIIRTHLPQQDWRIQPKLGRTPSASTTPTDHHCSPQTGHCRLNSYLKKIGVKTLAQCPCGEADQTLENSLQSCSLYHQARRQIRPTCVSPKSKLWGSAEDLFLTSKYVALTGERISSRQPSHGRHKSLRYTWHAAGTWTHGGCSIR